MEKDNYLTDNIWEWAAIKLEGGPDPSESIVMSGRAVVVYDRTELPDMKNVRARMPSNEIIALYNTYKHNIAFKKIDEERKRNDKDS